jgi:isopentenyl phosphate kinase
MVLKLGGSVITIKEKPMTPRPEEIRRLAGEIAEAPQGLILIHGGGSYGHPVADRYDIAGGYRSEGQLIGFAETHQAMVRLNTLVVQALLQAGVPALGVSPSTFIITEEGRIKEINLEVLREMLEIGLTPVLYGDAVLDERKGFTILSGDHLASRLAVKLKARRLIYGVDVDGVYTSDPKRGRARLLERVTPSALRGLRMEISTVDVTGGMKRKVEEGLQAAAEGVEVLIVNASKRGVILRALRGETVRGTWVVA